MKISGAKTVLRRRKFFNSCPTQALCLMLVSGIVIAHFHVVTLPPSYWLLIMLAASAFAILVKNELHKSLLILTAFLLAGALLTSLQEEQNRQPAATRSYSHLSALDRTRLKALSLRSELTERIGSQHLASQQQAIIAAMTLGEKGSLSKDTRQTFKASGASHILAIIRELVGFEPQSRGTRISEALRFLTNVTKKHCTAFLLSDFLDPGKDRTALEDALKIASGKHDLVGIRVSDPREAELPDVGIIEMKDAETGRKAWVDPSSARVREHYARVWQERSAAILSALKHHRIDTAEVSTDGDYVVELIKLFKQR